MKTNNVKIHAFEEDLKMEDVRWEAQMEKYHVVALLVKTLLLAILPVLDK